MLSRNLAVTASRAHARRTATQQFTRATAAPLAQQVRFGGFMPKLHYPPPPPVEYEDDGSLRKYPLNQPIYDHGYSWETWHLLPEGVFHTAYYAEFAQDLGPLHAWTGSFPLWTSVPVGALIIFSLSLFVIQGPGLGVKPKRMTAEWQEAMKERERVENTNPVTRYLDRRRAERGHNVLLERVFAIHPGAIWMGNSHDWDYLEQKHGVTKEQFFSGDYKLKTFNEIEDEKLAAKAGGGDDDDDE